MRFSLTCGHSELPATWPTPLWVPDRPGTPREACLVQVELSANTFILLVKDYLLGLIDAVLSTSGTPHFFSAEGVPWICAS